ncbi:MAG: peptidylprolyl isomerase [Gemmatimonadota bacterium]
MRIAAFLLLLVGASPLQAQVAPTANGEPMLVDRVVAVVGDTVLLLSDVQFDLDQMAAAGQLPQDPAQRDAVGLDILNQKVDNLVLVSAAEAAEVVVSEDQINEQVDQQIQQVEQRFGSAAAFEEVLAEEGLTLSVYRQQLASQTRDQALVQDFLRMRLGNRAPPLIDEEEIEQFFQTQRAALGERPATVGFRQVVIQPKPSPEAREAALATAQEVLDELGTGAEFGVLARRFSEDVGTAEYGGDLGWFGPGRMTPPFERAAFALRPGQTSGIVETDFGFHIIRVDRARGSERQARHILIQPEQTPEDVERAGERADSVMQAIEGGASMADLARSYNSPEYTATVTSAVADRLPQPVLRALLEAEPGELVGPVEFEDARGERRYMVARLTTRTEAGAYTLDDVRDQIRDRLEQARMVEELLAELRQQVYVRTLM